PGPCQRGRRADRISGDRRTDDRFHELGQPHPLGGPGQGGAGLRVRRGQLLEQRRPARLAHAGRAGRRRGSGGRQRGTPHLAPTPEAVMNVFTAIPVPVGNGIGAPVDLSAYGATKTIIVAGTARSTINVEYNNDPAQAGGWQSMATIQNNGPNPITVNVACRWVRIRVSGYNTSVGGTSSVNIGGTDAGTQFVALPVPAGNGAGAAVDVSGFLGLFKTVQIGGAFQGNLIVEISEDGTTEWAQPFSFQTPGGQSAIIVAHWMRVSRSGVPVLNPGAPVCNVGFTSTSEGSTSSSVAIGAGSQTATSGTVVLANSNNVTFGMSGSSQITARVGAVAAAAGGATATSGTVVFSNGNGVTFGLAGSVLTASVQTVGGTATGVGISAGTQLATTGAVVFSNSNGVTFGMNASTVTASYSQSTAPAAIAAGTQTATAGTVVLSNSNGVTFGM